MPRDVWEMPWPDAIDLLRYWSRRPPTNELLAEFMGVEERSTEAENVEADAVVNKVSQSEFNDLLRMHGIPVE